jgi:flagellar basal body-associated protein FliL|tara:strand:- start:37 stop:213 length:177 start_codon:yes stop_codon:yes gene_type:complete
MITWIALTALLVIFLIVLSVFAVIFIKEDNRKARLQQERYEQEKKIDEVFESIKSEIK